MGLDITVYANAELLPEHEMVEDCWNKGHVKAFCYEGFEDSLRGLIAGREYQAERAFGFRAGSYGGYNAFREALSQAALGTGAHDVWADAARYRNAPFYELINFADNEGTIGPEAAADLYEDFAKNRDAIFAAWDRDIPESASWYKPSYDEWLKAFEIAKDGGIVDFH